MLPNDSTSFTCLDYVERQVEVRDSNTRYRIVMLSGHEEDNDLTRGND